MAEEQSLVALKEKLDSPLLSEFPQRNEIVERLFRPDVEIDQCGFKRRIYCHGEFAFLFRGREELPIVPTLKKEKAVLLGSTPVHTSQEKFQGYQQEIEGGNRFLVVTKDIHGLVALLHRLAPDNTLFTQTLEEIEKKNYSQFTLDLIDSLIACNWVDENRTAWKNNNGVNGADAEALVIASLLGDREATEYARGQKGKMAVLDKQRQEKDKASFEKLWKNNEGFAQAEIKELVGVHVTCYPPRQTETGWEIVSRAEAMNGAILRNTCHITLNQKVASHYGGNWDLTPYAIISPFEEMLEANGTPFALNNVDTWWTRDPGETLKFPHGTLVKPGTLPQGRLIAFKERNTGERCTLYRGENYTVEDLARFEEAGRAFSGGFNCWETFRVVLAQRSPNERVTIDKDKWNFDKLLETFASHHFKDPAIKNAAMGWGGGASRDFFQIFREKGERMLIGNRIWQLLKDANLDEAFKGNPSSFREALRELSEKVTANVENRLYSLVMEEAVDKTIKAGGYMGSSELNKKSFGSLARKFGATMDQEAHARSPYQVLTVYHSKDIERARSENEKGEPIFEWSRYNFEFYPAPVNDKTRRVVYVSGAVNSRM